LVSDAKVVRIVAAALEPHSAYYTIRGAAQFPKPITWRSTSRGGGNPADGFESIIRATSTWIDLEL
jgi:hypothetical protein